MEPRIFQGTPLTEVPLAWLEQRSDAYRIEREKAAEVAPGVFVQVISWGDHFMPDRTVTSGARIAVWDERILIATQLRDLADEFRARSDEHHDERGRLDEEDGSSQRRLQTRAAYLSGLEFAFGDAAHMLSKILRLEAWAEKKKGESDEIP